MYEGSVVVPKVVPGKNANIRLVCNWFEKQLCERARLRACRNSCRLSTEKFTRRSRAQTQTIPPKSAQCAVRRQSIQSSRMHDVRFDFIDSRIYFASLITVCLSRSSIGATSVVASQSVPPALHTTGLVRRRLLVDMVDDHDRFRTLFFHQLQSKLLADRVIK